MVRKRNKDMRLENKFLYPYGAFYDVSLPDSMENSDSVIIYVDLSYVSREIRSLEGYFLSNTPLQRETNPVCLREQMAQFEVDHSGKFQGFSENAPTRN